ncbi:hypothetical protein E3N88_23536 [Mikania micrantha]|uniref:Uncharacterized protein n=1 Tax=Mikania micrantha TaxID=192012 RepID=A0A5N6NG34_9ASTR|nr:hypothetical protein E3N88_23536 [Mikania micrantha]
MKKMVLETDFAEEIENFRKRCHELEEKSKQDEMRCLMLEIEVGNLKKKNQELEGKITMIQKIVIDSTYVENNIDDPHELMVENKVLECEKRKAETELCLLKKKVKQLELNIKNMAPSTPGVAQNPFHGIIDVCDDDVNHSDFPIVKTVSDSRKDDDLAKSQQSFEGNIQKTSVEHSDEDHMDGLKFHSLSTRCSKRKRVPKVVISDDESNYDDNAPICTLKTQQRFSIETTSDEEVKDNVSKGYLTRLRRLESKNKQDESVFNLTKTVDSSEDEEENDGGDESESESESLGGFIVDSSENVSKCDSESGNSTDESEDTLNEFKVTLEKIGRKKISNFKWDLEGDMLSDFGKDPVLCMRAVCALYRQQTDDEKASKETIHHNERGFSQPDAHRASKLAEFLINGDCNGDLSKTVEELKEYDSKGIKLCMRLAAKYSKQLFSIYQNKEDPYFMPP